MCSSASAPNPTETAATAYATYLSEMTTINAQKIKDTMPNTFSGAVDTPCARLKHSRTAYSGRVPKGMEIGLQETAFFDPQREAWGFGTHIALVSIERNTGNFTLEKLVMVDDCGVVINPMIVEGQIHGGVAQGRRR